MTPDELESALLPGNDVHYARSTLLALENATTYARSPRPHRTDRR